MPKAMGRGEDGRGFGPQGRIKRLQQMVSALIRHERIEGPRDYVDEARGYAERLVQEASKLGDKNPKMMEVADYWLLEKDLIHKLFKVLVPRYQSYTGPVTSLYTLPTEVPGKPKKLGVLELKGNPWPPVVPKQNDFRNSLVNVLLDEARKDYRREKYEHIANELNTTEHSEELAQQTMSNVTDTLSQMDISNSSSSEKPS